MKLIRAMIYALMGGLMCWSAYQRGHYRLLAGIAFFTVCVIAITLLSVGKTKITWDEQGVSISKFPFKHTRHTWREMEKMTTDHLGYHIQAKHGRFRISRAKMPRELLTQIRESIRANKQ